MPAIVILHLCRISGESLPAQILRKRRMTSILAKNDNHMREDGESLRGSDLMNKLQDELKTK